MLINTCRLNASGMPLTTHEAISTWVQTWWEADILNTPYHINLPLHGKVFTKKKKVLAHKHRNK